MVPPEVKRMSRGWKEEKLGTFRELLARTQLKKGRGTNMNTSSRGHHMRRRGRLARCPLDKILRLIFFLQLARVMPVDAGGIDRATCNMRAVERDAECFFIERDHAVADCLVHEAVDIFFGGRGSILGGVRGGVKVCEGDDVVAVAEAVED